MSAAQYAEVTDAGASRDMWLTSGRAVCAVCLIYIAATLITGAHFMADTADYVASITEYENNRIYNFWEVGHLLWRPLGWLLYRIFRPLTSAFVGADLRSNVTLALVGANYIAGLVGALALYGTLRAINVSRLWALVGIAAFVFSHGFLNNAQIGSPYVAGLAMLLVGWCAVAHGARRAERRASRNLLLLAVGGAATACAVCLWLPYLWAVPAVVSLPALLFGDWRTQLRSSLIVLVVIALCGALAYGSTFLYLGLTSVAEIRAWVQSSPSVGTTETSGVTRMVFGFARSIVYMGNDGMIVKRYLLSDPFNPVTLGDLFRLSLWKLIWFYLFLSAISLTLITSRTGRRLFAVFALNAVPVLLFAILFDGGAIERYLPLYPAIYVALGAALDAPRWRARLIARIVMIGFAVIASLVNLSSLFMPVLEARQEKSAARIAEVVPQLRPASRVYAANWQDDLVNFNRSFPFHPINRNGGMVISALVTPGTASVLSWRSDFARQTLDAWNQGGDVWVSRRALTRRPAPDWNWVEGDERRVSWTDFHDFLAPLDKGREVGGEDGFILIEPSSRNANYLAEFTPRG